jgi:hypothetical protein
MGRRAARRGQDRWTLLLHDVCRTLGRSADPTLLALARRARALLERHYDRSDALAERQAARWAALSDEERARRTAERLAASRAALASVPRAAKPKRRPRPDLDRLVPSVSSQPRG